MCCWLTWFQIARYPHFLWWAWQSPSPLYLTYGPLTGHAVISSWSLVNSLLFDLESGAKGHVTCVTSSRFWGFNLLAPLLLMLRLNLVIVGPRIKRLGPWACYAIVLTLAGQVPCPLGGGLPSHPWNLTYLGSRACDSAGFFCPSIWNTALLLYAMNRYSIVKYQAIFLHSKQYHQLILILLKYYSLYSSCHFRIECCTTLLY